MDHDALQNLRYKLQRRVRRLNSVGHQVFHYSLKQFWGFIQETPLLLSLIEDLERRQPEAKETAEKVLNGEGQVVDSEDENAALCLHVIKGCVASESQDCEIHVGYAYGDDGKFDENIERFRTLFVEPLYDYLDEHIDDQRAILAHLVRYKHKCEWFQRDRLYDLWEQDPAKGEDSLSKNLYEYLYDRGVELSIEPRPASGRPDFISMQSAEDPLIADAKIFNPDKSKGKSYLISAFHQIYQYTLDYNQPFGYLVIFNTSSHDLKLMYSQQEATVPFVTHNHKTVFFVTVDVFPHPASASKRGQVKATQLSEEELVENVDD